MGHLAAPATETAQCPMDQSTFESKKIARAWARRLRESMSTGEVLDLSRAITAQLTRSPLFIEADSILTYVGSKNGELLTVPLIEACWAAGKVVLVPISHPQGRMEWSVLRDFLDLAESPRGILEPNPRRWDLVAPDDGLCIVPGLCFRRDGHRIGFGGGYYDRFLANFRGETVGLVPEALFGVDFPVEPHDRPVQTVVTEEGLYRA